MSLKHKSAPYLWSALLFLGLAILSTSVFGQITHTPNGAVDQQADALLKKASAKFSGTVKFTVTVVNFDSQKNETFRQKASILYRSPRYKVLAGDIEVFCDGSSIWQYNKRAKEVVVNSIGDNDDDITNPARLLSNYSKSYRAKYIREEADGTSIVDLQPVKGRSFHKLRLFIDTKSGLLKKMEQHNYDSSRAEYIISDFKNTKASDSDFTFDSKQHPGVEVVDMR